MTRLILTGDANLMGVQDAAVPFARVAAEFAAADLVFSNLEGCLYAPGCPPDGQSGKDRFTRIIVILGKLSNGCAAAA
jgi:hypothetical protein